MQQIDDNVAVEDFPVFHLWCIVAKRTLVFHPLLVAVDSLKETQCAAAVKDRIPDER